MDDLRDAVFNKCGMTTDQVILVGVSGGADSLALLLGLKKLGFLLKIAHLDHGLREDSKEDADFVEEFARSYHCLLYTSPSPRDRTRSRMPSSA